MTVATDTQEQVIGHARVMSVLGRPRAALIETGKGSTYSGTVHCCITGGVLLLPLTYVVGQDTVFHVGSMHCLRQVA